MSGLTGGAYHPPGQSPHGNARGENAKPPPEPGPQTPPTNSLYLDDGDVRLYHGDALTVLRELPAESVHMCVTSPPFYGLRDYGTGRWEGGNPDCDHKVGRKNYDATISQTPQPGYESAYRSGTRYIENGEPTPNTCPKCGARRVDQQIGLEETPEQWVASLVAVFREVRRVLRDDGTLWLEVGDSYANSGPTGHGGWDGNNKNPDGSPRKNRQAGDRWTQHGTAGNGLKPKDLIGAPWMLAKALQAPYYTGTIRDERDRIWLAAMVDAEGCIAIHRRPAGTKNYAKYERKDGTTAEYVRKNDSYQPKVEISNTDLALIERVIALTGEGNTKVKQEAGTFGRKQTIYRWTLTADKARAFLREVYPHLIAKQHEARLAIGCPSSGDKATAAHEALKQLHGGNPAGIDFPAPESLFEAGWYLRSDIVWSRLRPNPMPESVTDRPTKSHSYVFLLAKQPRYYWDAEAVREPYQPATIERSNYAVNDMRSGYVPHRGGVKIPSGADKVRREYPPQNASGRNVRSVWNIATQPYPEAHFATFPEELARRCILAGTSERGCCPDCGAPWIRQVETVGLPRDRGENGAATERPDVDPGNASHGRDDISGPKLKAWRELHPPIDRGWNPSCGCQIREGDKAASGLLIPSGEALHGRQPHPCIVLDPFVGSGTVPYVARKHGRHAIGIDLSATYLELAARRLQQLSLFA